MLRRNWLQSLLVPFNCFSYGRINLLVHLGMKYGFVGRNSSWLGRITVHKLEQINIRYQTPGISHFLINKEFFPMGKESKPAAHKNLPSIYGICPFILWFRQFWFPKMSCLPHLLLYVKSAESSQIGQIKVTRSFETF